MANGYIKLKFEYIFPEAGIDRTVVVPKDWSLAFLHEVIQECFGYLDYHEHEFIDAKKTHYVREEDPNWDMILLSQVKWKNRNWITISRFLLS